MNVFFKCFVFKFHFVLRFLFFQKKKKEGRSEVFFFSFSHGWLAFFFFFSTVGCFFFNGALGTLIWKLFWKSTPSTLERFSQNSAKHPPEDTTHFLRSITSTMTWK